MLDSLNSDPSGELPSGDDELLTAEEVAVRLRVSQAWVYAQTRGRRIPHVRLGRHIRYRRSALDAWIDELECGTRSAASAMVAAGARRR